MRRVILGFCVLLLVLLAAWALGPRVAIDETIHAEEIPSDIDAWIKQQEAAVPDLVAGSEKRIVWANGVGQRSDKVLVYLHGFSSSRQETAPLAENLASALGTNLFETRLTGHGRSEAAMTEASVNDWLNDAMEALAIAQRLGDEVIVIGVSTGGTLAWWLAARAPQQLDKLVLISPNFKLRAGGTELLAGPWGEQITRLLMGEARCFETQNPQQAKYWTECYQTKALQPMFGLLKLVESIPASAVSQPVFAAYSPGDTVVDALYSQARLAELEASQLTTMIVKGANDPKQHVLAGDILSPATTDSLAAAIADFVLQ